MKNKKFNIFTIVLIMGLLFAMLPSGQAQAASEIIYDTIPATLAPSYASQPFQAQQTFEFGDYVNLAGTNRDLATVSVTMVSWAYQSTYPTMLDPTGWDHPITLNIYNVIPGDPNVLGALIGTKTQTFHLPWRPEPDTVNCTENRWYDAGTDICNNGYAFNITFDMSELNITLPDAIVLGIAYNTMSYGVSPIGVTGPYDSLNISAIGEQTVGSDGNTDRVFWNTITAFWYSDGGASGVGTFREDTNWGFYGTVPFQVTAFGTCTDACYVSPTGDDSNYGTVDSPFKTIQKAISTVSVGGTVHVAAGTYIETGQIVINKDLTIIGENKATTIIKPAQNTGSSADTRAWWLVNAGKTFNLSNVTLDGAEKLVNIGILSHGPGTINNNILKNIGYNPSGPDYAGRGIAFYDANMTISNNLLQNIGRIGIYMYGTGVTNAVIDGNTYEGKGDGNWLDYGIEIEGGAVAEVKNNLIKNCTGVALVDGSGSASLLITTYFAAGSTGNIHDNTFTDNSVGISVGYGNTDTSIVIAKRNKFFGNEYSVTTTKPNVDASPNWFNHVDGPVVQLVDGDVVYNPWYNTVAMTAKTYLVCADQPWKTIQSAINDASAGDTILVCAGTYNEALTINKALTLTGAGANVTIVDGTDLTANTLLKVSGLSTGALNISGFTFKDDPTSAAALTYPVSISACLSPATVDFTNNTILGTGSDDYDWGLLLGYGSTCSYKINNNIFDNIGGNSILVEKALGPVEIGNNEFILPNDGGPAIFSMSYGTASVPNTVDGLHWYHDNHFSPKAVDGYIWSGIVIAPAWGSGWNVRQYGSYTNVLIEDNIVEDFKSVGIQVEVDGENSTLNGVIQNNILTAYPGISYSKGIRLLGSVSNTNLLGNVITNGYRGIYLSGTWGQPVYPTAIKIEKNQLAGNTIGYEEQDTINDQDASPNWWGSIGGPTVGAVIGNNDFTPWCGDPGCTFFMPDENGVIELSGPFKQSGGIQINVPGLTIRLKNGTVIQNDSPCFIVNASYTTITTETIGGAKCIPTSGSNGIDVAAGLKNIVIEGIEFVGTTGTDGIHFAGGITDVVITDNWFHGFADDGIEFTAQPAGTVDIQGNLFVDNTGYGINNSAGTADIKAEYNAWGDYAGAGGTNGDGISSFVDADPFTHVDLYMVSTNPDVDNWSNQVFVGEKITYEVKANLKNVIGAEFVLKYPSNLTVFSVDLKEQFESEELDYSVLGKLTFIGHQTEDPVISGDDLTLFTVTFNAVTPGKGLLLNLDETTDAFSMAPVTGGPSNNIYATALADITTLDVITRPTLNIVGLDGPFIAGLSHTITNTICNAATGGDWTESVAAPIEPDTIGWIRISDITVSEIASLQFLYEGDWYDFEVQNTYGGSAVQQDDDDVIARFGNYNFGMEVPVDWCDYDEFRVTFVNKGVHNVTVELYDMMDTPFNGIDPDDILLTSFGPVEITVDGDFIITGTISMQGRTNRAGVAMMLTKNGLPVYGPFNATSLNVISNNLTFTLVNGGTYTITTNMPRYLDVTADLTITVYIDGVKSMASLELKGGDANDDNVISVADASAIGGNYGSTADIGADVNYSGKVDIFDLAIVGGNFGFTPDVYLSWVP